MTRLIMKIGVGLSPQSHQIFDNPQAQSVGKCDDRPYRNDPKFWPAMQIDAETSLYDALEVSPQASASVIKAAYRCLAQRHHPDKNAGALAASERLAQINYAYAVLSDPVKRLRYDHAPRPNPGPPERRGSTIKASASPKPIASAQPSSRAFAFRPLADQ